MDIKYKLPKKYKEKPIGSVFKTKEKNKFQIETLISLRKECKDCKCWLDSKSKICSRCKSKKLKDLYLIYECSLGSNCNVNRYGCPIHFKSNDKHPFSCTCDHCN